MNTFIVSYSIVFLLSFICLCHHQVARVKGFPAVAQAKELRSMLILIYGVLIASGLLLNLCCRPGTTRNSALAQEQRWAALPILRAAPEAA